MHSSQKAELSVFHKDKKHWQLPVFNLQETVLWSNVLPTSTPTNYPNPDTMGQIRRSPVQFRSVQSVCRVVDINVCFTLGSRLVKDQSVKSPLPMIFARYPHIKTWFEVAVNNSFKFVLPNPAWSPRIVWDCTRVSARSLRGGI